MKLWRALVRIIMVGDDGFVWMTIPSRGPNVAVGMDLSKFPEELRNDVKADKRFHVICNLNDPVDMIFKDWEAD